MKEHLIKEGTTIVKALEAINALSGEAMTLFVTDDGGRLLGSLTDGDIRRALLAGRRLEDRVEEICNRSCLSMQRDGYDVSTLTAARKKKIDLLPVVDGSGVVVSLLNLRRQRGLIPADAVLMAGGAGERLRPLTLSTPKPLLPVGGRPIIDHNIELLHQFGIENIYVTVNYLKDLIIDHFRGSDAGVRCVEEPVKLGTAGSLSLIDSFSAPNVVVMNSDLLTDIDLEAMYLKHLETEAWLTMAVVPYTVSVPFAIVEHRGDIVDCISEKPTYNYFANAGIYMLRREAINLIRKGERLDATDLIELLLRRGERVAMYKIDGKWIDIGSPDDYRHACEIS